MVDQQSMPRRLGPGDAGTEVDGPRPCMQQAVGVVDRSDAEVAWAPTVSASTLGTLRMTTPIAGISVFDEVIREASPSARSDRARLSTLR